MNEIEFLGNSYPDFSEERILDQAYDLAKEKNPEMPSSKSIIDDYKSTLASDDEFRDRYQAVFYKNA